MRVRRAVVGDARAIAAVHTRSAEDAYRPLAADWRPPEPGVREQQWAGWLREPRGARTVLVAERESVVGFVCLNPGRRPEIAEHEVSVLHVLPAHRARGVGSALWEGVVQVAGRGATVYVETFAELRCCGFYEARGGQRVHEADDTYMGGRVRRVVYVFAVQ
ncbi:MAG: GNAT family N-acetyltransferase [Alphaproteobacteria bacterium]|nr:GNAT family N-acetyltransferase [Alphaproteobacteria bacterium]